MHKTSSGVILALVVLIWGCGGDGDGNGVMQPPAGTGTVQGSVRDDSGNPVAGAVARLRNAGSTTNLASETTGTGGSYTFSALAAGDYDVFLEVPIGFDLNGQANPVRVSLTDGGNAQADFSLTVAPVSFSAQIQPIFNRSCAFTGCHGGASPNPPGKPMNLSSGQAYANIVNEAADQLSTMDRIEPGDNATSYLIHKLEDTQGTVGGSGSRMPLGAPALPQVEIDLIRRWVTEGSPNN